MECTYELCIYQSNDRCRLDHISIDELGMCSDCILVSIPSDVLEEGKQLLLKKYQKE